MTIIPFVRGFFLAAMLGSAGLGVLRMIRAVVASTTDPNQSDIKL